MKITVNKKKEESICVEKGDLLLCRDKDDEEYEVRQIVLVQDFGMNYCAVDVICGNMGLTDNDIYELVEQYAEMYGEVKIIKNRNVELFISEE